MSSIIRGDDNFDTADGGDLDPRMATAWVNFNGTGTVAIQDQLNVTSITDNGLGNYTVNLTSALADANYSAVVSANQPQQTMDALTTTTLLARTFTAVGATADASVVCVTVHGGQA